MDLSQLKKEADTLARPARLLDESGDGPVVASWRGHNAEGPVVVVRDAGKIIGVVSQGRGSYSIDLLASLPEDGTPLYSREFVSFPPIDAIFRLGSEKVEAWLASNKWKRDWPYNGTFGDSQLVDDYERWWQGQNPFYQGSGFAIAGGWHMAWGDDDWEEFIPKRLVLWTLRDAEPWIEVWEDSGTLRAIPRVT